MADQKLPKLPPRHPPVTGTAETDPQPPRPPVKPAPTPAPEQAPQQAVGEEEREAGNGRRPGGPACG